MTKKMILGGYLIDGGGNRHQLPVVSNPSKSVTDDAIRKVAETGKGVLVMRTKPPPEVGPYELQMHFDAGYFLLMLNVWDDDGDHSVRTPTNPDAIAEWISILGEKYSAQILVRDIDLVCMVFGEFATTATVPFDLLN